MPRAAFLLLRLFHKPKPRLRRRYVRVTVPQPKFIDGETFPYCGVDHILRITQDPTLPQGLRHEAEIFRINFPSPLRAKNLRDETRLELLLWYKREARRDFRARLDFWAEKLGVCYGRMIVTSPSRRWGSCNYRNDIRLTWRLMLIPPELIDYVVAHELCHVRHKNHGKNFWAELASIMPDWKQRRQNLRAWEGHTW